MRHRFTFFSFFKEQTMQAPHLLSALCLACGALLASPASAVQVTGTSGSAANGITIGGDFSGAGVLAFEYAFTNQATTTLHFTLEAGDIGAPLSFSALIANINGLDTPYFSFSLSGTHFDFIGTAQTSFTNMPAIVTGGGPYAQLLGNPSDSHGYEVGDFLLTGAGTDWRIDTAGMSAGDGFSLTLIAAPVPEPGTLAMMATGLAAMGAVARRRRKTGR